MLKRLATVLLGAMLLAGCVNANNTQGQTTGGSVGGVVGASGGGAANQPVGSVPHSAAAQTVALSAITGYSGVVSPNDVQYFRNPPAGLETFTYAASTLHVGQAGCQCVPPLSPERLTLVSMDGTTCTSIHLTVLSPWGTPNSGDRGGTDQVFIVQSGGTIAEAATDNDTPEKTIDANLSGGPWAIQVTEISPAPSGGQASVYINGTLSCGTSNGR